MKKQRLTIKHFLVEDTILKDEGESYFKALIEFDEEAHANAIYKALTPEIKRTPSSRFTVTLKREGKNLMLRIKAKDIVALRAAMNAYMRYLSTCYNILTALYA